MTTRENEQRDDLARIIVDELHPGPQDDPMTWPAQVWRLADAIVEGIKPRTITTVEELDALPVGSVILDTDAYVGRKERVKSTADWSVTLHKYSKQGAAFTLPVTVLHEPGAEVGA